MQNATHGRERKIPAYLEFFPFCILLLMNSFIRNRDGKPAEAPALQLAVEYVMKRLAQLMLHTYCAIAFFGCKHEI